MKRTVTKWEANGKERRTVIKRQTERKGVVMEIDAAEEEGERGFLCAVPLSLKFSVGGCFIYTYLFIYLCVCEVIEDVHSSEQSPCGKTSTAPSHSV